MRSQTASDNASHATIAASGGRESSAKTSAFPMGANPRSVSRRNETSHVVADLGGLRLSKQFSHIVM
jgi:hypothetical protein